MLGGISWADCHRFVSTRFNVYCSSFCHRVVGHHNSSETSTFLRISFNCRSHTFCVCLLSTAFTNKDNLLAPFLFLKPPSFFASESLSNFLFLNLQPHAQTKTPVQQRRQSRFVSHHLSPRHHHHHHVVQQIRQMDEFQEIKTQQPQQRPKPCGGTGLVQQKRVFYRCGRQWQKLFVAGIGVPIGKTKSNAWTGLCDGPDGVGGVAFGWVDDSFVCRCQRQQYAVDRLVGRSVRQRPRRATMAVLQMFDH